MQKLIIISIILITFSGCNKDKEVTTASGLKYSEIKEGTGISPAKGKLVTVHYIGSFQNGEVFQSSVERKQPYTFTIGKGEVIPGWDEGIMTMKIGGRRKLIIPPNLAYGAEGAGGIIPPNATLNFEIELLDVK